jgi:hypothetical protein
MAFNVPGTSGLEDVENRCLDLHQYLSDEEIFIVSNYLKIDDHKLSRAALCEATGKNLHQVARIASKAKIKVRKAPVKEFLY